MASGVQARGALTPFQMFQTTADFLLVLVSDLSDMVRFQSLH